MYHQKNDSQDQKTLEQEEETAELEIADVDWKQVSEQLDVADNLSLFQLPASGSSASSSSSVMPPPQSTPNVVQNASLFGLSPTSIVSLGNVSVWVEFQTCLASGVFAHVFDSGRTKLLGHLKTTNALSSSFSFNALCKVHKKPAGSCKCWVTFSNESQRKELFMDLLKWIEQSDHVDKASHLNASTGIRKAYGMRIRT